MHAIVPLLQQLHDQLTVMTVSPSESAATAEQLDEIAEALHLVDGLQHLVEDHGVHVAERCLRLLPIATAKGESAAELDVALDRIGGDLMSHLIVAFHPKSRFPVSVVSTGKVDPGQMLGLSQQTA